MTQKILSQKSPSEQSDRDLNNANRIATAIKKAKHIERLAANPKALASQEGAILAFKLLKQSSPGFDFNQWPATMLADMIKKIPDYKESPPESLYHHFDKLSETNKNKINAIMTCIETELPWQDFFVFEKVGESFNNRIPKFSQVNPLSPGECCWTVRVMDSIVTRSYTEEIKTYIAAVLFQQGFLIPPQILDFAGPALQNYTKVTDTERLKELYQKRIIHDNNEVLDRQLKKLAACDYYLKSQAVIE